jgi:hypothetical protein
MEAHEFTARHGLYDDEDVADDARIVSILFGSAHWNVAVAVAHNINTLDDDDRCGGWWWLGDMLFRPGGAMVIVSCHGSRGAGAA